MVHYDSFSLWEKRRGIFFSGRDGISLDQAFYGHLVDALAHRGEEGRGTLRKAAGRGEHPLIRGYPNGETRPFRVICR